MTDEYIKIHKIKCIRTLQSEGDPTKTIIEFNNKHKITFNINSNDYIDILNIAKDKIYEYEIELRCKERKNKLNKILNRI
jgi:uncharacterized protein YbgA (DUF1722 family)